MCAALILGTARASAQLPTDVTASPTRDTGGWVYGMAQLLAILGVLVVVIVVAGFLRWAPSWADGKRGNTGSDPASAKSAAPTLASPVSMPSLSVEAAEASAASIGEKAHAPQSGAVPVVGTPSASTQDGSAAEGTVVVSVTVAPPEPPASGAADVYETTLGELLDKGVPQKVAEARAKMAAKKAGG